MIERESGRMVVSSFSSAMVDQMVPGDVVTGRIVMMRELVSGMWE